ncbi:DNA polymerase III subunit gamma/tau [Thiomicrorhabdus aquaedulcis]|uniref:DNA polymerase III subunit gamma/tau n=1 Tax=Thiomicrorhabdus aquaedulcis TaxID=2211106 RepID=UPI000FDBA41F|nr:DNA polymerase III subunit gamma/tau [Thiomicrorhabdus aquaedulcis]
MSSSRYTVLARKWRPKNFAQLVGQGHVMQALSNALDQQRLHHAYLFTGTRGVGKTTIARIFAKALNCQTGITSTPCGVCETCVAIDQGRFIDLIEVDAASRTKVDDTREILDNVQFAPTQGRFKVYLIDEVHMLSKSSFNALLKTLEEPPEHVKFLLATTDPHKLPITVLSRCLQFNLMRLTPPQIQNHLAFILQQEAFKFEDSALALIAKSADGSARDALSLLDQAIAYGAGEVLFEPVQTMLGLVDQQFGLAILNALASDDTAQIKAVISQLAAMGVDYQALLAQLIETLHAIASHQLFGDNVLMSVLPDDVLHDLSQKIPADRVQMLYQIALLSKQDMLLAPDIRIGFEMTLIRMLAFVPLTDATALPVNNASNSNNTQIPNNATAAPNPNASPNPPGLVKEAFNPLPVNAANVNAVSAEPELLNHLDAQQALAGLASARSLMGKKVEQVERTLATQSAIEPLVEPIIQPLIESNQAAVVNEVVEVAEVSEPSSYYAQPQRTQVAQVTPAEQAAAHLENAYEQEMPPWLTEMPYEPAPAFNAAPNREFAPQPMTRPGEVVESLPERSGEAMDHLAQIRERLKQPLGKFNGVAAAQLSETAQSLQPSQPLNSLVEAVETQDVFQEVPVEHPVPILSESASASISQPIIEAIIEPMFEPVLTPPQERAPISAHGLDWLNLIEQMQLDGMAFELARHCILVRQDDQAWWLSVDPEQAYAKTDMAQTRLRDSIKTHFGAAVQVDFVQGSHVSGEYNTPAKQWQAQAQARQVAAQNAIMQDPNIGQLHQTLGLSVIATSVHPL